MARLIDNADFGVAVQELSDWSFIPVYQYGCIVGDVYRLYEYGKIRRRYRSTWITIQSL